MFAITYRSAFAAESAALKAGFDSEAHDKCLGAWSKGLSKAKASDTATLRRKLLDAALRASRFVLLTAEQVDELVRLTFDAAPEQTAAVVAHARPGIDRSVQLALAAANKAAAAAGFASAGADTSRGPDLPLAALLKVEEGAHDGLLRRLRASSAKARPEDDKAEENTSAAPLTADALLLPDGVRTALDAADVATGGVAALAHGVHARRCELLVEAMDAALDEGLLEDRDDADGADADHANAAGADGDGAKRQVSLAVERCVRDAFKSFVACPSHRAPAANEEYAAWEPTGVPRFDKLSREAAAVGLDVRRLELQRAVAAAESSEGVASVNDFAELAASVHKLVDYELGGGESGADRAAAVLVRALSTAAPIALSTSPASVEGFAGLWGVVLGVAARLAQLMLRAAAERSASPSSSANAAIEMRLRLALAVFARTPASLRHGGGAEEWWRCLANCSWAVAASCCRGDGWAAEVLRAAFAAFLAPRHVGPMVERSARAPRVSSELPLVLLPVAVTVARAGAALEDLHHELRATLDEAQAATVADGSDGGDAALVADLAAIARVAGATPPATDAGAASRDSSWAEVLLNPAHPRGIVARARAAVPSTCDGDAPRDAPLFAAIAAIAAAQATARRITTERLTALATAGAPWTALIDARRASAKTDAKLSAFVSQLEGAFGRAVARPLAAPANGQGVVRPRDADVAGAAAEGPPATREPRPERTADTTLFVKGLSAATTRAAFVDAVANALPEHARDSIGVTFRSGANPTAYLNFADAAACAQALERLPAALGGGKVKVVPYQAAAKPS